MTLRTILFIAFMATVEARENGEQALKAREDRIQKGRKEVHEQLDNMADRASHLVALSKDDNSLEQLASEIQTRVKPTLTDSKRKALEDDYQQQVSAIKQQDMSASDAQKKVANYSALAEKDLNTLRDADRKDARALHSEFMLARRDAQGQAKEMARAGTKALHSMGSAAGLEMAMERVDKTEHEYDTAEDRLQSEKDKTMDQVISMHDHLDHLLDNIYDHVWDHLEAKAHALEEDATNKLVQRREALKDAAQQLQMTGSLRRVEKKLSSLEQAMQKSKASQELISSPAFTLTSIACTALIAAVVAASLVMHAMQRRVRNINQPELLA